MNSNAIIIGVDEDKPLIEIYSIEYNPNKIYEKILFIDAVKDFASIAAQAAPALMIAREVASKQIMEVVINGSLAQAADGDGLRAFSRAISSSGKMGKIQEHARLYNADSLSRMVNVAAVWQIASVVVAQKHLADINKKLENLQESVDKIVNFLESDREARVFAILKILKEKIDLLSLTTLEQRNNVIDNFALSNYDYDLNKIYIHVTNEIQGFGFEKIQHKETFGTADLKADIEKKINKMTELSQLAFMCLDLRLVCCDLNYHGTDMQSVKKRLQQLILEDLEIFNNLLIKLEERINTEIQAMSSIVNTTTSAISTAQKTLNKNKINIIKALVVPSIFISEKIIKSVVNNFTETSILDQSLENELSLLDRRKAELKEAVRQSTRNQLAKYNHTKETITQEIHTLEITQQSIKLAFQKIDNCNWVCLNTGDKILV